MAREGEVSSRGREMDRGEGEGSSAALKEIDMEDGRARGLGLTGRLLSLAAAGRPKAAKGGPFLLKKTNAVSQPDDAKEKGQGVI